MTRRSRPILLGDVLAADLPRRLRAEGLASAADAIAPTVAATEPARAALRMPRRPPVVETVSTDDAIDVQAWVERFVALVLDSDHPRVA